MSEAIKAKIKELEAEYARTQKNKQTEGHLGLVKAKLAKLKRELLEGGTGGGGGGGGGRGFDVSKTGDTRIGFVGFPSVGKSTLLTALTGTESLAAAYEFTTLTAVPGTMTYRGAKIQMVDLPGIIEGAKDGKGRGRQVISTARTCNMLLICLDAMKSMQHKKLIERELDGFGIRLNQEPPDITFRKKEKGGLNYQEIVPQVGALKRIVFESVRCRMRVQAVSNDYLQVAGWMIALFYCWALCRRKWKHSSFSECQVQIDAAFFAGKRLRAA
eukprot:TRINITY_DN1562_c0_g1_i2.p1 TRINITY_DN1562_c0_g1~~TRINITY_DN1562_c0_g1_i2.p1  ORF type:complete len:272 (+),score=62.43 TRINITY_DN1562_c0_g1_i2:121-936(+)